MTSYYDADRVSDVWTVVVWRFRVEERDTFPDRSEAVGFALALVENDNDCAVEGVFGPDGALDEETAQRIRPWEPQGFRPRNSLSESRGPI